ncbi:glycosyltransferase [Croceibacterium ferulae]|uniref:glycosyltransferase n=1 Tax=Croceibacterium ferulae TaxID=1854641 RepID=UPI0013905016|nr:glycosyltransferase [Croceibacterium ferulae]
MKTSAPVNFVYESTFDRAALEAAPSFEHHAVHDADFRALLSSRGDTCWAVATYYHLRERGYTGISLSLAPRRDCINVLHSEQLRKIGADPRRFDICIQADFAHRPAAQFHILQNARYEGENRATIWLYPQIGILPRTAPAGRLTRIGYLGHVNNSSVWSGERWQAFLQPLGVEFVTAPPRLWHDFSDLDAVIAIRDFGKRPHYSKPPSKLINAWIAGVPFIGGSDSAYRQIGTPGEDFLLATSPQEVRDALDRLRRDPALVSRLVQNGRQRMADFTVDRLIEKWVATLEGPAEARFLQWQHRPGYEALRSHALATIDRGWVQTKALLRTAARLASSARKAVA